MQRKPPQPLELFYCYARQDRVFCEELDNHLAGLRRSGFINTWYDGVISPGADWEQEIKTHLETAHIVLLLISPDFLASDQCYSKEMVRAIERHRAKEAHVIPIRLRPVDLVGTPFISLQMLPSDARPVTQWPSHDDAFEDVAKGVRYVVNEMLSSLKTPPTGESPRFTPPIQSPITHAQPRQLASPPFSKRLPTGSHMRLHHTPPGGHAKSNKSYLAIIGALVIIVIAMSIFAWYRPLGNTSLSQSPQQNSPQVPSTPTPPPPTPTPSPTPVTISKNIHLACLSDCDYDYFDVTLTSYVVNRATGSITFNYAIAYRNTKACEENADVYLVDEERHTTPEKSGSMFEHVSFTPGQTMQQNAVVFLVPTPGTTYTLHTQIACDDLVLRDKQATPLTF